MAAFGDRLLTLIKSNPGKSDRELTELLLGKGEPQQQVNQEARLLEQNKIIKRQKRLDGLIGNYPTANSVPSVATDKVSKALNNNSLAEDEIKKLLKQWLEDDGWSVEVAWGKARGVDIVAVRGNQRKCIEVKGCGSLDAMRVNYFLAVLGETLQRMDSETTDYFIALPDMRQFRALWERLPPMAKLRTRIRAIFVSEHGAISEAD